MTKVNWRPHQVRQQADTVVAQGRTLGQFRQLPAPPPVGPGQGFPTFAELVFHFPTANGDLVAGVSDPHSARWQCALFGAYIDVATFSTSFTLEVWVNGSLVPGLSCAVTGGGEEFLANPVLLRPRIDLVTVNATSPGTGNLGVIVRVLTG